MPPGLYKASHRSSVFLPNKIMMVNNYAIVVCSIHFQPGLWLENHGWTFRDRAQCREVAKTISDKCAASKLVECDRPDEDKQRGHVFRGQETHRALQRWCLVVNAKQQFIAENLRRVNFSKPA